MSTIALDGVEIAAVHVRAHWLAPVPTIAGDLPATLFELIGHGLTAEVQAYLTAAAEELSDGELLDAESARYAPLYRNPGKIWGIGLNYGAHAQDLNEIHPEEPASFMKANHTIVGPGDEIVLPSHSGHITAEAELGLIVGSECQQVDEHDALKVLVGVCPVLDQTAVDILQRNPRFLTRSKNYPTFFSFGPLMVTIDEALGGRDSLDHINVGTFRNGEVYREDLVSNMRHKPEALISLHSEMMPFHPGDIISPGSPGGVRIDHGDVAECRIDGIGVLRNPVTRTVPMND